MRNGNNTITLNLPNDCLHTHTRITNVHSRIYVALINPYYTPEIYIALQKCSLTHSQLPHIFIVFCQMFAEAKQK
jgi:hypothetical protein